jgi:PAS domain S-box-containing protein
MAAVNEDVLREHQTGEAVDYRTLVEQIPAITYIEVHDPSSSTGQRTTYVSPQAARMLGHTPQEFLADPGLWRKLRHPADRATVMAAERAAEVTKQPFHVEYRMRHRDGRQLWFRDDAVIVEDPSTGGTFWQGVMFDITAEKQAEEQFREAELRYHSLVESLPAMIYIDNVDEIASNIYTSPQTLDMFGYAPEEWYGDPGLWKNMIHPEDRERVMEHQQAYKDDPDVFEDEYRIVAKDGRVVWVHDFSTVVRDEEGTPLYSQGFVLDVSPQKGAELSLKDALDREREQAEQLRSIDSLKNTLLHTLSHDLKHPLTAILAAATALQRPGLGLAEAEARELLAGMASRAKRMDRLLTDLLDLDRLGRGILEPARFPVEIAGMVNDLVEETELLEGRKVELALKPVSVSVDKTKVERMVENLLTNAVRHTAQGTHLWVKVEPSEGGVLIAVEDDGQGIPDELKEAIFEPFRQGPEGETHPGGTGIGLSLVARFAELHGGRAWVQDRGGGGSSFRVFLPNV